MPQNWTKDLLNAKHGLKNYRINFPQNIQKHTRKHMACNHLNCMYEIKLRSSIPNRWATVAKWGGDYPHYILTSCPSRSHKGTHSILANNVCAGWPCHLQRDGNMVQRWDGVGPELLKPRVHVPTQPWSWITALSAQPTWQSYCESKGEGWKNYIHLRKGGLF